jgi:hypothetical protein
MRFEYDDGGRAAAGYKGKTGDCACRAIAIATCVPYQIVYDMLNEHASYQRITKRQRSRGSARTGVYKSTIRRVLEEPGWRWTPTHGDRVRVQSASARWRATTRQARCSGSICL